MDAAGVKNPINSWYSVAAPPGVYFEKTRADIAVDFLIDMLAHAITRSRVKDRRRMTQLRKLNIDLVIQYRSSYTSIHKLISIHRCVCETMESPTKH